MEVVIKIPDELYKKLKTPKTVGLSEAFDQRAILVRAIQNGTVLPKGHGRLIDADKLDTRERGNNSQRTMWWNIDCIVKDAETIIEADKG